LANDSDQHQYDHQPRYAGEAGFASDPMRKLAGHNNSLLKVRAFFIVIYIVGKISKKGLKNSYENLNITQVRWILQELRLALFCINTQNGG
jgi:hypothetical protein